MTRRNLECAAVLLTLIPTIGLLPWGTDRPLWSESPTGAGLAGVVWLPIFFWSLLLEGKGPWRTLGCAAFLLLLLLTTGKCETEAIAATISLLGRVGGWRMRRSKPDSESAPSGQQFSLWSLFFYLTVGAVWFTFLGAYDFNPNVSRDRGQGFTMLRSSAKLWLDCLTVLPAALVGAAMLGRRGRIAMLLIAVGLQPLLYAACWSAMRDYFRINDPVAANLWAREFLLAQSLWSVISFGVIRSYGYRLERTNRSRETGLFGIIAIVSAKGYECACAIMRKKSRVKRKQLDSLDW